MAGMKASELDTCPFCGSYRVDIMDAETKGDLAKYYKSCTDCLEGWADVVIFKERITFDDGAGEL